KLKRALSKHPGHMESWGIDLAERPGQAGKNGLGEAWPYYLLVVAVVASGYYQQRQMTARTPASAQNQQAQMMGRIFPAFFGLISLSIPAGVVVYFIASNLWQIGQQAWIFREQDAAKAKGSPAPSGRDLPPRDAESRETGPNAATKPQQRPSQRSGNRRRTGGAGPAGRGKEGGRAPRAERADERREGAQVSEREPVDEVSLAEQGEAARDFVDGLCGTFGVDATVVVRPVDDETVEIVVS